MQSLGEGRRWLEVLEGMTPARIAGVAQQPQAQREGRPVVLQQGPMPMLSSSRIWDGENEKGSELRAGIPNAISGMTLTIDSREDSPPAEHPLMLECGPKLVAREGILTLPSRAQ